MPDQRISFDTAAGALTGTEIVPLVRVGSAVTAGSFVIGITYSILSIGTTDFTLIGAASNTVGLSFVATGVGSGTGTAGATSNVRSTVKDVAGLGALGAPTTLTASASATLDFTGLTGTAWKLVGNMLLPATNAVDLWLRFGTSTGPTWQTASYDYEWSLSGSGGFAADGGSEAQAQALLAAAVDNTGSGISFDFTINGDNANWVRFFGILNYKNAGRWYVKSISSGYPTGVQITGIRLLFSSGNIASGKASLYSLST